jgi:predicted nucleic acid-binding protein
MQKNIYPIEVIISDTSSLSNLINIGRLDLLEKLYNNVTITPEIYNEYKLKFKDELPNWITTKEVKNKEKVIEINKEYGIGESSAIALALETPNTLIIIDDQEAKLYASKIGLSVIGTIGVIKQAVDKKIIKNKVEANNLFDDLKNTGGWISDKLLKEIKYPIPNIEEMKCYKHETENKKIIDFRGNEIVIMTMEMISEKENLCKFDCTDKKGNNIYILQRIKNGITDIWYFDKNFNKESADSFIYFYEKENINNKKLNNIKNNTVKK